MRWTEEGPVVSNNSQKFGLALYTESLRLRRGLIVTDWMNYADIQRLKAADRAETLELFRGSYYCFVKSKI